MRCANCGSRVAAGEPPRHCRPCLAAIALVVEAVATPLAAAALVQMAEELSATAPEIVAVRPMRRARARG